MLSCATTAALTRSRPPFDQHPSRTERQQPLTHAAGLPQCTVHDLRHLAVTTAVGEGVDITIVSKTVRHASVATTADLYAHLTRTAARQAVDAIAHALAREERRQARAAGRKVAKDRGHYGQAA
ncbi:tyrosine-type recombinase/integrase [Kitasatospora sp. NPDC101801]|uniref:tyrosine-type recombinase/integrase n=1 Tax=Kitasatospora sp. NPDC101801 TaxID=3364103 RepID=UPI00380E3C05